jgi:parallel beta-helix repeat protein
LVPYRGVVVVVVAAIAAVVAAVPAQAKTLQACKKGCAYKTIEDAVDASGKGDTVRVKPGTYNEGVLVIGHKHDKLKLQGSPSSPKKTKLIQRGLHGTPAQNAVAVSRADNVTITGFYARDFKTNGFYVENANGYKLDRLIAERDGEYGLFAFNSIGGSMTNSTAYYFNDAGFYVGQTPVQRKPKRTKLSNLTAYLNVLGYSGTNSRYVDIENSDWFNNGDGIVPNSLDSERFPPNADNTIRNNRVFWNNFNYYLGAPFRKRKTEVSEIPYPVGMGILLYGGRGNRVENNQVFGNWLAGVALLDAFTLKNPAKRPLVDNQVLNNSFGLSGTDLNGRDLAYEGGGSANCFQGNQGVTTMFPADGSTIVPCTTPPTPNVFDESVRNQAIAWATDPNHEVGWIPHEHAPQQGLTPIEHWGS